MIPIYRCLLCRKLRWGFNPSKEGVCKECHKKLKQSLSDLDSLSCGSLPEIEPEGGYSYHKKDPATEWHNSLPLGQRTKKH